MRSCHLPSANGMSHPPPKSHTTHLYHVYILVPFDQSYRSTSCVSIYITVYNRYTTLKSSDIHMAFIKIQARPTGRLFDPPVPPH